MDIIKIIDSALTLGKSVSKDENLKEFICGTYSDGTTRNVTDAMHGEFLSPKQKKKIGKKKKKKKNNFKL